MNKVEIEKMVQFVDSYKEISSQIELMQKSILSLGKKRDALIEKIEDMQEDEKSFLASLSNKYGESNITPYKLLEIYEKNSSK